MPDDALSENAHPLPESIRTLPQAVAWWATRRPDAPALEATGWKPVSYRALWGTICRIRSELHEAGIGRGSRLAVLLPEGLPLAVATLSAIATAAAAPIDFVLRAPERERLLAGLRPDALLTSLAAAEMERLGSYPPRVLTLRGTEGPSLHGLRVIAQPGTAAIDQSWPTTADTAYIFHTSGTTGEPKPVPHVHDSYMTWARDTVRAFGIAPSDRTLGLGSLAQAAGEVPLRHALVAGSVFVAGERSASISLLDCLDATAPTWLYLPAGIVHLIAAELDREPSRRLPSSLRFVRFTSAGISHDRLVEMEERFGVQIYPEYSSNEAGIIARVAPPAPRKPGSVGKPYLDVKIVDESGARLPAGVAGEILVRGPTVTHAATAAIAMGRDRCPPGGWLGTGDLGYLDGDGFLFVTGRRTEVVNRGGAKIVPDEVDEALRSHPDVAEAAAFGVPDARLGEDIVAAVVLQPQATVTARRLRAWLLDRLSAHKVPRRIWIVAELPRTATGKVPRGELARRWSESRNAR